jgi:hypothetical protein
MKQMPDELAKPKSMSSLPMEFEDPDFRESGYQDNIRPSAGKGLALV